MTAKSPEGIWGLFAALEYDPIDSVHCQESISSHPAAVLFLKETKWGGGRFFIFIPLWALNLCHHLQSLPRVSHRHWVISPPLNVPRATLCHSHGWEEVLQLLPCIYFTASSLFAQRDSAFPFTPTLPCLTAENVCPGCGGVLLQAWEGGEGPPLHLKWSPQHSLVSTKLFHTHSLIQSWHDPVRSARQVLSLWPPSECRNQTWAQSRVPSSTGLTCCFLPRMVAGSHPLRSDQREQTCDIERKWEAAAFRVACLSRDYVGLSYTKVTLTSHHQPPPDMQEEGIIFQWEQICNLFNTCGLMQPVAMEQDRVNWPLLALTGWRWPHREASWLICGPEEMRSEQEVLKVDSTHALPGVTPGRAQGKKGWVALKPPSRWKQSLAHS